MRLARHTHLCVCKTSPKSCISPRRLTNLCCQPTRNSDSSRCENVTDHRKSKSRQYKHRFYRHIQMQGKPFWKTWTILLVRRNQHGAKKLVTFTSHTQQCGRIAHARPRKRRNEISPSRVQTAQGTHTSRIAQCAWSSCSANSTKVWWQQRIAKKRRSIEAFADDCARRKTNPTMKTNQSVTSFDSSRKRCSQQQASKLRTAVNSSIMLPLRFHTNTTTHLVRWIHGQSNCCCKNAQSVMCF